MAAVSIAVLVLLMGLLSGGATSPETHLLEASFVCIERACYKAVPNASCQKQNGAPCMCDRDFQWSRESEQCKAKTGSTFRLTDLVCLGEACFLNVTQKAGVECADQRFHRQRCCARGYRPAGNTCVARSQAHPYEGDSLGCEDAINELIRLYLTGAHKYMFMSASLRRDWVAYPGLSEFFLGLSAEHRGLSKLLISYQNKRGGVVELRSLKVVNSHKWDDVTRPYDAVSLSLKDESSSKKEALASAYSSCTDSQTQQFLEDNHMEHNIHLTKRLADMFMTIERLRQTGNGGNSSDFSPVGEYLFDRSLLRQDAVSV